VYPDNDHLVEILYNYLSLPDFLKQQKRFETRKLTEQHYNWDNIAKKWEKYFDSVVLKGLQGKWKESLPMLEPINNLPPNISPYDAITGAVSKHMPQHQLTSSLILLNMIRDLDYGFSINGMHTEPYTPEHAINSINNIITNNNVAQNVKNNQNTLREEDFIQYANMKESIK